MSGTVASMAEKSQGCDVLAIRALIERWAEAVRREELNAIRADHDPDILMFDLPPPFLSRGLDLCGDLAAFLFRC